MSRFPVWAMVLLSGCSAAAGAPAPVDVRPGVDDCEYCHMAIDDPDRAAEWVERGGRVHTFDEPGCLLAWLQGAGRPEGVAFLADDAGSGWVPAGEATLLRGAQRTAMGFDIVALRDRAAAVERAERAAAATSTWDEQRREGVPDVHAR